ncbi:MAG: SWIM zinc finger family protein, partial [Chitinophagaceae bacterium]
EKGTLSFDELAKRMIDAKAPGIANLIKKLSTIDFYKEGWENDFLSQLVHIYSIITAYKNASSINSLLMGDVKNLIGFTTKQEQLLTYDGITDNWLVIGKEQLLEDTILVERNWLYGIESKKYALILQFSVRWQINSALLVPGSCIHATLIFYPSAMPLRAIVKEQHNIVGTPQNIAAFLNWKKVADSCINSRLTLPFNQDLPFIVQQVTPLFYQNTWWLKDEESSIVKLEATENVLYNLLALSGGNAITVTVVGNNHIFKPIGVWKHHQFISL